MRDWKGKPGTDGEDHRFVMIETRNEVDDGTEKHLVRYTDA